MRQLLSDRMWICRSADVSKWLKTGLTLFEDIFCEMRPDKMSGLTWIWSICHCWYISLNFFSILFWKKSQQQTRKTSEILPSMQRVNWYYWIFILTDRDECFLNEDTCDEGCQNIDGGYTCSCSLPKVLFNDTNGVSGYFIPDTENGLLPTDTYRLNQSCVCEYWFLKKRSVIFCWYQSKTNPKMSFVVQAQAWKYFNIYSAFLKSPWKLNCPEKDWKSTLMGAQWLSGRVLDSRPKGQGFKPHGRHCVVVLEQDTFILA